MTPAAEIAAMRALIADPERWTAGVMARDKDGRVVYSKSPHAVRWCAAGAGCKLGIPFDGPAWRYVYAAAHPDPPAQVNDRGHADALALLDRAHDMALADQEAGTR